MKKEIVNNKICVDIDGVLRNMLAPMIDLYNREFNLKLEEKDVEYYDVNKSFPLIKEKLGVEAYDWFFNTHRKETLIDAEVCDGAHSMMKSLHKKGFEVIIVTYQPSLHSKLETLTWLDKNDIYYDKIVFTNEESKKSISDSCSFIIDDRPEYLLESKANKVCIKYAYNKKYLYGMDIVVDKPNELVVDMISYYLENIAIYKNDKSC